MSDPITDALAQAKATATNLPAAQTQPTQTAVALPQKKMTAADFMNAPRINVDAFLKVSEFGLSIGQSKELVAGDSFEAQIDLSQIEYPIMVRFGQPAEYYKTYDQVNCANKPFPWQRALELAKTWKNDRSTDPYMSADVLLRLSADVKGSKGGELAKAGQVLGYTPPQSGAGEWFDLLKAVAAAGGDVDGSKVRVKVGHKPRTNKAGNNWGVVTYEFLGLVQ